MIGRQIAFSVEELEQRLSKVQAAIRERGWFGLLVHAPENIYYLSGYQTSGYFAYQVLFVPAEGEPLILVRDLERTNLDEYSWLGPDSQAVYLDVDDPVAVTHRLMDERGWTDQTVAVEKSAWFLTIAQFERLVALMPSTRFVDGSGIVDKVRLIKSPAEIDYIRQAAKLVDIGMGAALDTIAVGKTDDDVAAAIHEAEIRNGCEYTGLPHYISTGHRIFVGHANWTGKPIEAGERVHLELSGCVKRYSAVMMRAGVMGQPSAELERMAEILISSQEDGIRLMEPGVPASEIDDAIRQPVLKAGLRETYHQRVGYSIGIGFPPRSGEWDALDIMAGDTWKLEAGMVFHMIVHANGMRFSETVAVTETGHEKLTSFERKLFTI